jgi:hypothetical protein
MDEHELQYDRMIERALRGVALEALARAAEHGLPGDHHFYVTFRTGHPGVEIPDELRERYPDEMTIVLQHQFSNLSVGPDGFSVTLSFSGVPRRLVIPAAALTSFADPSVRFLLPFPVEGAAAEGKEEGEGEPGPAAEPGAAEAPEAGPPEPAGEAAGEAAEKIVTLDAFRKR